MLIHVYIYICIPVYCLYIVFTNIWVWLPLVRTIVVLLLFFIFLVHFCISLFYSFVCSSHLCILSYMHVPYEALFINKEFEFVCKLWEACSRIIKNIWLCCLTPLSIKLYSIENIYDIIIVLRRKYFLHSQSSKWNLNLLVGIKFLNLFSYSFK